MVVWHVTGEIDHSIRQFGLFHPHLREVFRTFFRFALLRDVSESVENFSSHGLFPTFLFSIGHAWPYTFFVPQTRSFADVDNIRFQNNANEYEKNI